MPEASKPSIEVLTLAEVRALSAERDRLRRELAAVSTKLSLLDRKIAAANLLIEWAVKEGRLPPDASGIAARSDTTQSGVAVRQEPDPKGTP